MEDIEREIDGLMAHSFEPLPVRKTSQRDLAGVHEFVFAEVFRLLCAYEQYVHQRKLHFTLLMRFRPEQLLQKLIKVLKRRVQLPFSTILDCLILALRVNEEEAFKHGRDKSKLEVEKVQRNEEEVCQYRRAASQLAVFLCELASVEAIKIDIARAPVFIETQTQIYNL